MKTESQQISAIETISKSPPPESKDISLILFAVLVGALSGAMGALFRHTLSIIDGIRETIYDISAYAGLMGWLVPVAFAVSGITIALLMVRKFAPETSGSGVQEIEGALDELRPLRWRRVIPVKFVASLFSLGSGLLLGREGPTIQVGANIGRMVKDVFRHPDHRTNTLVAAGGAAGLASAFNAPLAGVIFVIEEMHGHFRYTFFSVIAIMGASGMADFVVRALIGPDPVIKMTLFPTPPLKGIWLFALLGLLFSLAGYLFNIMLVLSLDIFRAISRRTILVTSICAGTLIAVTGIIHPEMIGGGYETIRSVLDNSFSLELLLIIFVSRYVLTIISYGSGVPGGVFAPLLALGVVGGMMFGGMAHQLLPGIVSHPGVFAVAGMAGIFASTVRAPLTGLVLAVEMTSNFELILPLIITTATASLVTTLMGNQPLYTTLLKRTLALQQEEQHRY